MTFVSEARAVFQGPLPTYDITRRCRIKAVGIHIFTISSSPSNNVYADTRPVEIVHSLSSNTVPEPEFFTTPNTPADLVARAQFITLMSRILMFSFNQRARRVENPPHVLCMTREKLPTPRIRLKYRFCNSRISSLFHKRKWVAIG